MCLMAGFCLVTWRKELLEFIQFIGSYFLWFILVLYFCLNWAVCRQWVCKKWFNLFSWYLAIFQSKWNRCSCTGCCLVSSLWNCILYDSGFFHRWSDGAACIVIIILTSCFLNHRGFGLEYPFSHVANHYMLLFLMGMMMSYFNQLRVLKTWVSVLIASIGFLLFVTVALDQVFWLGLYNKLQTIMFGVSCSLIIYGLSNSERGGFEIGGHSILQVLGNASYSLYLLHFPLLSLLCKVCVLLGINDKGLLVTPIAYAIIFFLCVYISIKFTILLRCRSPSG